MKKNILTIIGCIVLAVSSNVLWGQTQVIKRLKLEDDNTITPMSKDALIQMDSNDKGMLLPRVALTDAKKPAPLTAHTAGMTVYNTATVSSTADIEGVEPGYYYNNGTKWVRLTTEVEAEWKDGTVSGTNLIYAKQAKEAGNDVVITDDGKVGIGVTDPKSKLDVNSFVYANGYSSYGMPGSGTPILHPTFIGFARSGGEYTSPEYVKSGAVLSCYVGRDHKSDNEAISAGNGLYGGAEIYMSATEDYTATSKGSKIDFYTTENGSNRGSLRMTIANDGNLGIGTENPQAKLDVNGKVRIADGSQQDGRVLTSDADGVGTWQALSMGNKTTKWILSGEENFTRKRIELQGKGSFEGADEIGLTISGNQVSLPAGKYIAFIDFDIAKVAEYGQFDLMNEGEESPVFSTVYGEWLNGATILLRSSNAIKLKAYFHGIVGPQAPKKGGGLYYADPEPSGYTKKFYLKMIFLKLN